MQYFYEIRQNYIGMHHSGLEVVVSAARSGTEIIVEYPSVFHTPCVHEPRHKPVKFVKAPYITRIQPVIGFSCYKGRLLTRKRYNIIGNLTACQDLAARIGY